MELTRAKELSARGFVCEVAEVQIRQIAGKQDMQLETGS